jgi:hypothetical protein
MVHHLDIGLVVYPDHIKEGTFDIIYLEGVPTYLDIHYGKDNTFLYTWEKASVIESELALCGYFCIVPSERMSAEQALILYKGRNASEELFRPDYMTVPEALRELEKIEMGRRNNGSQA